MERIAGAADRESISTFRLRIASSITNRRIRKLRKILPRSSKAVADTLAGQLKDFRDKTSQTVVDLAKPDPEQMQKLAALGYVGFRYERVPR